MKKLIALLGLVVVVGGAGCAVQPVGPAGVSVGVYGEYPHSYYGHGGYYGHPYYYGRGDYYSKGHYRWHHPYDRDHYYYRSYVY